MNAWRREKRICIAAHPTRVRLQTPATGRPQTSPERCITTPKPASRRPTKKPTHGRGVPATRFVVAQDQAEIESHGVWVRCETELTARVIGAGAARRRRRRPSPLATSAAPRRSAARPRLWSVCARPATNGSADHSAFESLRETPSQCAPRICDLWLLSTSLPSIGAVRTAPARADRAPHRSAHSECRRSRGRTHLQRPSQPRPRAARTHGRRVSSGVGLQFPSAQSWKTHCLHSLSGRRLAGSATLPACTDCRLPISGRLALSGIDSSVSGRLRASAG